MTADKKTPNYRALFVVGLTFIGAGVVFLVAVSPGVGAGLIGMGVVLEIVGLKHRGEWGG